MDEPSDPLAADRQFFAALIDARRDVLDRLLADDFLLIDVMTGSEVPRDAFLALVGSGQLKFEAIEPAEVRVRLYPPAAVVTGRTRMQGRYEETPFEARSRYTHVYVDHQGRWRMVTAQGTPIVES
jgi:Domain of unknown function (DUF4440)